MYQGALDNPFVFDDRETVLLNPSLITPWDWRAALVHNPARPVVNLSYAVDRALWGFSSFGFHVTNVILHITAVGLFYGWCTRVLGARDRGQTGVRPGSERGQRGVRAGSEGGQTGVRAGSDRGQTPSPPTADWAAFFAASVFALHPVMSSAVGYVSARSELLAAAGFLVALTFTRRAIVGSNRNAWILAGIFAVLAMGSSSSAIGLPVIALAFDAWVLRHPGWRVRLARIYAPATLAFVSIGVWQVSGAAPVAVPARGPIENLLTGSAVVWQYLALLVVPRGQSLVHDVHWPASIVDPISLVAAASMTAAVAVAIWKRRQYPLLAFGIIWFLGVLAPSTSFLPVRDVMAEHRLYLAFPGLLLAVGSLAWRPVATRRVSRIALVGVLGVLAVATYRRTELWSSPMELWLEAVRRAPHAWQSHWGHAELLREIGNCEQARSGYDAVLRLYPGHAGARAGLDACQ